VTGPVDEYVEAAVQRLLAEHESVAEQGITVTRREQTLVLHGDVESTHRCEEILRLVSTHFPGVQVHADLAVTRAQPPQGAEELR